MDKLQVTDCDVAGCDKQEHARLLPFTVYCAVANALFTCCITCQGDIVHFRKYNYSTVQSVVAFLKNPHYIWLIESSCPCVLFQSSAVLPSVTFLPSWSHPVLVLFGCSESNAVGKELQTKKESAWFAHISAVRLTDVTADHSLLMLAAIIIIPIHCVYTWKLCEYELDLSFWNIRGSFSSVQYIV